MKTEPSRTLCTRAPRTAPRALSPETIQVCDECPSCTAAIFANSVNEFWHFHSVNLNNVCTAHSLTHSGFGTLQRTTSQCSTLRYQRGLFSVGSMATHSDTYRPAHYRQSELNYSRHAAAVDNAVTRSPSIDSAHKDPRWRAETNCSKKHCRKRQKWFRTFKRWKLLVNETQRVSSLFAALFQLIWFVEPPLLLCIFCLVIIFLGMFILQTEKELVRKCKPDRLSAHSHLQCIL